MPAYQDNEQSFSKPFTVATGETILPFRFAKAGAIDGQLASITAAGSKALGVVIGYSRGVASATAGDSVWLARAPADTLVEVGAAGVTAGDDVASDSVGRAVTAGYGDVVLAVCNQTGVSGDRVSIALVPPSAARGYTDGSNIGDGRAVSGGTDTLLATDVCVDYAVACAIQIPTLIVPAGKKKLFLLQRKTAAALVITPPTGGTIDGGAVNAPFTSAATIGIGTLRSGIGDPLTWWAA